MNKNLQRKGTLAIALVAMAALALLGGLLTPWGGKELNDKPARPEEARFQVALQGGARWSTSDLLLAIEDSTTRSVEFRNIGSQPVGGVVLSAEVTDSGDGLDSTAELSEAILVTVMQDSTVLAEDVPLAELDAYKFSLKSGGLLPGRATMLKFTYEFDGSINGPGDIYMEGERDDFEANPDNRFQGASLAVAYQVDTTSLR